MLCIHEELNQLSTEQQSPVTACGVPLGVVSLPPVRSPSDQSLTDRRPHSAKEFDVAYREGATRASPGGWFDGLLGCLRPVWSILNTASADERKGQGKAVNLSRACFGASVDLCGYPWPRCKVYIGVDTQHGKHSNAID